MRIIFHEVFRSHHRPGDWNIGVIRDWIVRDDVFIKYLKRNGPLTIGYGSPDRTGGDHGYHYLGNAIWFTRIGYVAGESMLELLKNRN